jgi:hypothetical protein
VEGGIEVWRAVERDLEYRLERVCQNRGTGDRVGEGWFNRLTVEWSFPCVD